ncbi:MAG TPA: magnesium transporter [Gemmatimonadaceae bacterium]|jgi:magnesium transporter|nr:magnesium transporter [Gemmatimonadaceae bacterium]
MPTTLVPPPDLSHLTTLPPAELSRLAATTQTADLADAIARLRPAEAARVLTALPFDAMVRTFDEPELWPARADVVTHIEPTLAATLITAMSGDEGADLFRELPARERDRYLAALPEQKRATLRLLLQYPEDSAGGIMTPAFVSVPSNWSPEQVLAYIRQVGHEKETIYDVYVLDPEDHQLVAVLGLNRLLLADPHCSVLDIAGPRPPLTVSPHATRLDVARLVSKYNLLAAPVVDEGGHVLGIVTVDDVIDALVSEQTRQVQRLGGSEAFDEPYMQITFWEMIRKRAGWLSALFIGEMLTATAMGHFEAEIAKAVVLSLFIPLVISSGGNSGSQATSLIIRALALRQVRLIDWWRIVMRELPTGIALGTILGILGVARILIWQHLGWYNYGPHATLVAFAVGAALIGVVTFGSLAGSMLPFVIKRLGFDPASASAPFVATLVDVTGLVIYFTVALVILRGTLL